MPEHIGMFLLAGLVGGAVNAAAGGAKLFVFPMLLATGLPPVVANATSTVALWPAQITAAWVYRRELLNKVPNLLTHLLPALTGSLCGAFALINFSEKSFVNTIPFLLLLAVGTIMLGPRVTGLLIRIFPTRRAMTVTASLMFGCGFYGAYFGAGLGFMLLAILTFSGTVDIQHANAQKILFAFLINTTAVIPLALSDLVHWVSASTVLVAGLVGGYLGAQITRHVPDWFMRAMVATLGLLLTLSYFVRQH